MVVRRRLLHQRTVLPKNSGDSAMTTVGGRVVRRAGKLDFFYLDMADF